MFSKWRQGDWNKIGWNGMEKSNASWLKSALFKQVTLPATTGEIWHYILTLRITLITSYPNNFNSEMICFYNEIYHRFY